MGPLAGYRIVELGGIGPGPMCAMLLSDLGADVVRIERPDGAELGLKTPPRFNLLLRGRRRVALDLKQAADRTQLADLIARADALIEGYRPGAMERLGLGPDDCLARNPGLVYGRMTGWGQEGPLASTAGHDLNYIALTGVLDAIGREGQPPTPPLNLVGDFGGGALYLALGIVAALLEAKTSGRGQVVDAAMVDGAASLMTMFQGLAAAGTTNGIRGRNVLDSGAPFYDVYKCGCGGTIALAAIETKFRMQLFEGLGLAADDVAAADNPREWPRIKADIARRIATKTRDQWCALFDGTDACVTPVLTLAEAPHHPHAVARRAYVEIDGVAQPAPAPRFSRSQSPTPVGPAADLTPIAAILASWPDRAAHTGAT